MSHRKCHAKKYRLQRFLPRTEGFIANAMKTERPRHLSISPSGRRTTGELSDLKVYSCPDLKLPSLMERASRSKTRLLYEMSAELLNSDDEENLAHSEPNDTDRIVSDSSLNDESLSDVESRKVEEFYQIKTNQLMEYNQKDSLMFVATSNDVNSIAAEIENDANVQKQLQMVQVNDDDNLDSSSTTAVENFEMPTASERLTMKRNLNISATKIPEKPECWGSFTKKRNAVKSCANQTTSIALQCEDEFLQPTVKCKTTSVYGNTNSKYGTSNIECTKSKQIWKNDYGIWISLVLLFLTFTYLYYILWHDVSEYVNRNRKYQKLVAESGNLMTIYYYIIYLLNF